MPRGAQVTEAPAAKEPLRKRPEQPNSRLIREQGTPGGYLRGPRSRLWNQGQNVTEDFPTSAFPGNRLLEENESLFCHQLL